MRLSRHPATRHDFEFARTVHHEAYRSWVVAQFGPWDEAAQDRFFKECWERQPHEIIEADGRACGYCSIEKTDEATHLREFAIDRRFRGRGIGGQFLRSLVSEFGLRGKPFRLRVFEANTRAIAFYRRIGFVETGATEKQLLFEWPTQARPGETTR